MYHFHSLSGKRASQQHRKHPPTSLCWEPGWLKDAVAAGCLRTESQTRGFFLPIFVPSKSRSQMFLAHKGVEIFVAVRHHVQDHLGC